MPVFIEEGNCTFLGHFNKHDLYYSEQIGFPTVIARYGSKGHEYVSGIAFVGVIPELTKAYELAKNLRLITRE